MTSSQIHDGGRPLVYESLCRHISVNNVFGHAENIVRFSRNFVRRCKIRD